MGISTHSSLPLTVQAGDTLLISETLSEYSAASWTLHYVITGGGNTYRLDSTASGTAHSFTEASETTGAWKAGDYTYQKYVDNSSGQRKTIAHGAVRIQPNVAEHDPRIERKRKLLENVQALLEGRSMDGVENYSIAGQSITKMTIGELRDWEARLERQVKDLEREARIAAGVGDSRRIQFRF